MKLPPTVIETSCYLKEINATDRYTAYGNFLDRFRSYDKEIGGRNIQEYIIKDKPVGNNFYPVDMAKIAATVEILARERNLEIPEWVYDRDCFLKDSYYGEAKNPEYRKFLKETSLPEFKKRNLFLGDNCMSRA